MPTTASAVHDEMRFDSPRLIVKSFLPELQQHDDQAVHVRLCLGRSEIEQLDPFILFVEFSASHAAGFPKHAHRGFEAITYMLQGAFTFQDFEGHKVTIKDGDVQLMTVGRGIIHSEMPAGDGIQKGLQLWINLSSKDRMIEPAYQEVESKGLSYVEKDGFSVRIIAGEAFGIQSQVYTRTPIMYLDFTINPGAKLNQPIPESWNAFVYIIEGEGVFGKLSSSPALTGHTLVLSPDGDGLSVWNQSARPLRFLLIAGKPLNEPFVRDGPFVMNTQAEIDQTIEDYRFLKDGFENGRR